MSERRGKRGMGIENAHWWEVNCRDGCYEEFLWVVTGLLNGLGRHVIPNFFLTDFSLTE